MEYKRFIGASITALFWVMLSTPVQCQSSQATRSNRVEEKMSSCSGNALLSKDSRMERPTTVMEILRNILDLLQSGAPLGRDFYTTNQLELVSGGAKVDWVTDQESQRAFVSEFSKGVALPDRNPTALPEMQFQASRHASAGGRAETAWLLLSISDEKDGPYFTDIEGLFGRGWTAANLLFIPPGKIIKRSSDPYAYKRISYTYACKKMTAEAVFEFTELGTLMSLQANWRSVQ